MKMSGSNRTISRTEHFYYLKVGVRIEELREAGGFTAAYVDQSIGKYHGYTRRVELGAIRAPLYAYHRIAMAIDVQLRDLVDL